MCFLATAAIWARSSCFIASYAPPLIVSNSPIQILIPNPIQPSGVISSMMHLELGPPVGLSSIRELKHQAGDHDGNVSETIKLTAEDKRSTWAHWSRGRRASRATSFASFLGCCQDVGIILRNYHSRSSVVIFDEAIELWQKRKWTLSQDKTNKQSCKGVRNTATVFFWFLTLPSPSWFAKLSTHHARPASDLQQKCLIWQRDCDKGVQKEWQKSRTKLHPQYIRFKGQRSSTNANCARSDVAPNEAIVTYGMNTLEVTVGTKTKRILRWKGQWSNNKNGGSADLLCIQGKTWQSRGLRGSRSTRGRHELRGGNRAVPRSAVRQEKLRGIPAEARREPKQVRVSLSPPWEQLGDLIYRNGKLQQYVEITSWKVHAYGFYSRVLKYHKTN